MTLYSSCPVTLLLFFDRPKLIGNETAFRALTLMGRASGGMASQGPSAAF
jgi:hypothetical protein